MHIRIHLFDDGLEQGNKLITTPAEAIERLVRHKKFVVKCGKEYFSPLSLGEFREVRDSDIIPIQTASRPFGGGHGLICLTVRHLYLDFHRDLPFYGFLCNVVSGRDLFCCWMRNILFLVRQDHGDKLYVIRYQRFEYINISLQSHTSFRRERSRCAPPFLSSVTVRDFEEPVGNGLTASVSESSSPPAKI